MDVDRRCSSTARWGWTGLLGQPLDPHRRCWLHAGVRWAGFTRIIVSSELAVLF
jgi:hypothetical protein